MVDGVLLLVDAVEGPMPQTRFVTQKAFAKGLKPIVVINKIDRDGARPDWVLDQTFDLFDRLGATDEQLDFPVIYASALKGYAGTEPDVRSGDTSALLEAIVAHVPPPDVDVDGPLQLQVSSLDYDAYIGMLGIGRITRGTLSSNMPVAIVRRDGQHRERPSPRNLRLSQDSRRFAWMRRAPAISSSSAVSTIYASPTRCARATGPRHCRHSTSTSRRSV